MALQGIAWMGMLARYSTEFGLSEGLRKTFDGKHPCTLCRRISQEGGHHQTRLSQLAWEKQAETLIPAPVTPTVEKARPSLERVVPKAFLFLTRSEPPPVPPPRGIALDDRGTQGATEFGSESARWAARS